MHNELNTIEQVIPVIINGVLTGKAVNKTTYYVHSQSLKDIINVKWLCYTDPAGFPPHGRNE